MGGARPSQKLCGMDSKNASILLSPTKTFSQSSASASALSADTRSNPSPHATTSLPAGSFQTKNTSLPSPPLRVSLTGLGSLPSAKRSLPSCPITLSEPLPPKTTSLPSPPATFLLPPRERSKVPPSTISLPEPPRRLSLPARPKIRSFASLPRRLSALSVPFRKSRPSVPTLFTASANPLATNKVKAITATTNIARLIVYPSSFLRTRASVQRWVRHVGGERRTPITTTPSSPSP